MLRRPFLFNPSRKATRLCLLFALILLGNRLVSAQYLPGETSGSPEQRKDHEKMSFEESNRIHPTGQPRNQRSLHPNLSGLDGTRMETSSSFSREKIKTFGRDTMADLSTIRGGDSLYMAWVARYDGPNGIDVPIAICVDANSNVYVTGSGTAGTNSDYATIKYDATGVEQWIVRYNGPGNGDDRATALVNDANGNVYVTGSSGVDLYAYDFATVKYDASGVEQWVARYNGPASYYDAAYAIAVDEGGNVYVTGESFSQSLGEDYATIKYNPSGGQEWVARYNGPGGPDYAYALEVDAIGNVYVTGESGGDYATIKYNPSGVQDWVVRYDGMGNYYFNVATALAIDVLGNVYVTGSSYSTSTSDDYATIKYDPLGAEQWVARYDGPVNSSDIANALAVDQDGNVYVTGSSPGQGTLEDYATIKYDPSGVEQWVTRYGAPEKSSDRPNSIAVDASGSVFVTGYSGVDPYYGFATIKYDGSGVEQWIAINDDPENDNRAYDLAIDGQGNVYVTGWSWSSTTSIDYATIKYDQLGIQQWTARYDGPGDRSDLATALAIDEMGNVYVTGGSGVWEWWYDYATVKYDQSGVQEWVTRYNGPANGDDYASAIAVDAKENLYVTGRSGVGPSLYDYATIKYDPSGQEEWVARYDGPGSGDDRASDLCVDAVGNAYVTGGSGGNYATIKYDPNGELEWVARYVGGNGFDAGAALAVDQNGNVCVTGSSRGSGTGIFDFVTIKYDLSGQQQWIARYDGPTHGLDAPTDLTVDAGGNVYVTGYSGASLFVSDYLTIKYDEFGAEHWVARYNGEANGDDKAHAITKDLEGNVYVTGKSRGFDGSYDYVTIKYDPAGIQQWVARYNGLGNYDDEARALCLDESDNVFVTGESGGSYATVRYSASGEQEWVSRYDNSGTGDAGATALGLTVSGDLFVTGFSGVWPNYDYTTIKYQQVTTEVETPVDVPDRFFLRQNYPNPFNASTTIEFSIPEASAVSLHVFNLLGEEVETLVSEQLSPGSYSVQWNANEMASGIYFYRLVTDNFVETKRFVLLK